MHPGLALVVRVSKNLGGFPGVTLNFGLHGVLLNGHPLIDVHYM
jgi:hypothetical protein